MKIKNTKVKNPSEGLRRKKASIVDEGRLSILNEASRQEILYISVDRLIPYHKQARRHFDEGEIKALAETITDHGIRQPLTVINSPKQEDAFEVISGERRLRAASHLGIKKIPCILLSDSTHAEEIALIENLQRKDLHPLELGEAYANLISNGVCGSQKEIAEKLGVPRTQVVEHMAYTNFPEDVKAVLIEKNVQARKIYRAISKDLKDGGRGIEKIMDDLIHDVHGIENPDPKKTDGRPKTKKMIVGVFTGPDGITISNQTSSMLNIESLKNIKKELRRLMYLVDGQIELVEGHTVKVTTII